MTQHDRPTSEAAQRQGVYLGDLMDGRARAPDDLAVLAPGRAPLTYRRLALHVTDVGRALRNAGIRRRDRIIVVTHDGVESPVTMLAVAASATCVPLPASCSLEEFEFYLRDAGAKAVIALAGEESQVRAAARSCGLPVLEAVPLPGGPAGLVRIAPPGGVPACDESRDPDDAAIVFYTSGTSGRAKKVPVSHARFAVHMQRYVGAMELTHDDRCIDMMPVCFYAGFASFAGALAAGGSVVFPARLEAEGFFDALEACGASWYTAAPAMHAAIIAAAGGHADTIAGRRLRFIRCGGAAPPHRLLAELERTFRAPVRCTYGMTEVGLIALTPSDARPVTPGALAVIDPDGLAILDDAGCVQPPGGVGEIAVRGAQVFDGYEDDPEATHAPFLHGWFRTGDEGLIDADGYLRIRGRIKELINRGGVKVSPYEVEHVLARHPSVKEAAVFAVPHRTLGEDVAAAVVTNGAGPPDEEELRLFAASRLSASKVPSRIVAVDALPLGPTGKVLRTVLAERLAAVLRPREAPAVSDMQRTIAAIWTRTLALDRVGIHDNFFTIGGDSLSAAKVHAEIEATVGRRLPRASLWQAPTVAQLAALVAAPAWAARWRSLVVIRAEGSRPKLFCIHEANGTTSWLQPLIPYLPDQPLYGLHARGLDGISPPYTRIEEMAAAYLEEIKTEAPTGPYFFCGYSFGGMVALEMAHRLRKAGEPVALVAALDARFMSVPPGRGALGLSRAGEAAARRIRYHVARAVRCGIGTELRLVAAGAVGRMKAPSLQDSAAGGGPQVHGAGPGDEVVERTNRYAARQYVPPFYPHPVTLIVANDEAPEHRYDRIWVWNRVTGGRLDISFAPGDHTTLPTRAPAAVGAMLRAAMDKGIARLP
jgi:acyl-CoA synthetase (AMP-forming)/AMP-acid ligase II/thioesterase domain-containing protein/acyl carrier protein